ncbi:hypothetical protein DFP72DRAFT_1152069 [Ephemerocybe angulata]|uniref:Uncharacterized protein n=1 Tax=Ephemerocybe angulata TaxID=980116 RepID=A0A8H6LYE8_9AGAR|nr:hypothetical protein DFP72DRAFT_1152069 [Tulosesus angulatus]
MEALDIVEIRTSLLSPQPPHASGQTLALSLVFATLLRFLSSEFPLSTSAVEMSKVVVDDTNSNVKYSGYWESSYEYGATVHSTWDWNSKATFSFRGTNVIVYGTIPQGNGETVPIAFSLDGGTAVTRSKTSGSKAVTNQVWYDSGTIADADHTISIIYRSEVDMAFQLDRIEYVASKPQTTTVVQTSTSTTVVTYTSTSSRISTITTTGTSIVAPGSTVTTTNTSTSTALVTATSTIEAVTSITSSTTNSTASLSGSSSESTGAPSSSGVRAGDDHTVTATQYIKTVDAPGATDPSANAAFTTSASGEGPPVDDGFSRAQWRKVLGELKYNGIRSPHNVNESSEALAFAAAPHSYGISHTKATANLPPYIPYQHSGPPSTMGSERTPVYTATRAGANPDKIRRRRRRSLGANPDKMAAKRAKCWVLIRTNGA